ncbi:MAG: class I SAM-dependent methyltransferase [Halothiobacillaceae bacterium]|nr:MAG: class I SAM-dependent methyltransferase [Halothiobacillaceae bacterium]
MPGKIVKICPQPATFSLQPLKPDRLLVPLQGRGLEIGVGSGRFAAPLGIQVGVDPSEPMMAYARARGIEVVRGVAEDLPFADDSFDHVLAVTTICFVRSAPAMLAEARRVLRPGGSLIIGFVDKDSPLGRHYLAHQAESVFYRPAVFFSATEVENLLRQAGFTVERWVQTLFRPLDEITDIEPLRPGHGEGGFVVVAATSPGDQPAIDLAIDRTFNKLIE